MVTAVRLEQGRAVLAGHGVKQIEHLPDNVVLWYADEPAEVRARLEAEIQGQEAAA
jgi:hypothetical protein